MTAPNENSRQSDAPFHAHLLWNVNDTEANGLQSLIDPEVATLTIGSDVRDAAGDGIQMLIAGRFTEENIQACKLSCLSHVVIPWTGLPDQARVILQRHPTIAVHNLHHNGITTAEMAITLLLTAAKEIIPLDQALRKGDWTPRYTPTGNTIRLHGQTALIIGFGVIGQHIAKTLHSLGMQVHAICRNPEKHAPPTYVTLHPCDALHALLPTANAILLALPLTELTRGLIGQPELALLPARSVLVNVARAGVVDEKALYDALASRRLHAAGLDVWYHYPENEASQAFTLPSSVPLFELDNVVLSPHRGGAAGGDDASQLRWIALAEVIHAAARNEMVPNRVDLDAGY